MLLAVPVVDKMGESALEVLYSLQEIFIYYKSVDLPVKMSRIRHQWQNLKQEYSNNSLVRVERTKLLDKS